MCVRYFQNCPEDHFGTILCEGMVCLLVRFLICVLTSMQHVALWFSLLPSTPSLCFFCGTEATRMETSGEREGWEGCGMVLCGPNLSKVGPYPWVTQARFRSCPHDESLLGATRLSLTVLNPHLLLTFPKQPSDPKPPTLSELSRRPLPDNSARGHD